MDLVVPGDADSFRSKAKTGSGNLDVMWEQKQVEVTTASSCAAATSHLP